MHGIIKNLLTKLSSHPGWKWFILVTVLLGATGVTGMFAFSQLSSASFIPPETVQSLPADSSHGLTGQGQSASDAKKPAVKDGTVTEHGTDSNDWALNLLYMIN
ncbi:MAG: hypothetical protein ACLQF0_07335 [Dissulfurispiraceae bacterium]